MDLHATGGLKYIIQIHYLRFHLLQAVLALSGHWACRRGVACGESRSSPGGGRHLLPVGRHGCMRFWFGYVNNVIAKSVSKKLTFVLREAATVNTFGVMCIVIYINMYIVVMVKAGLARAGDVITFLLVSIGACFYLLYVVANMFSVNWYRDKSCDGNHDKLSTWIYSGLCA